MGIDLSVFITYIGAILLLFIFGRIFLWPLKIILKLVLNSVIGAAAIMLVNLVGSAIGLMIPLNIINACIVGILGLPGAIMLIILTL